jgi:carbamoylphosphate synthase large subunit
MTAPLGSQQHRLDGPAPRILLLMPSTSFRAKGFVDAARRLGVRVTVGSNHRSTLQAFSAGGMLALEFDPVEEAVARIVEYARRHPVSAVIGTDEETTVMAAAAAAALSLRHNTVESAAAAHDKYLMRRALAAAGLKSPGFALFTAGDEPRRAASGLGFPCVVKPRNLCGSRGVIRVNSAAQLTAACRRTASIIERYGVGKSGPASQLLVESYIPGREVSVEGLLHDGDLIVLALFDKPDPLEGPFFEETIFVTPSRLALDQQELLSEEARRAASAIGLTEGPVHAELRINADGAWIIEIASRSIGGLCSRALRFPRNLTLDDLIVRHASGLPPPQLGDWRGASGVMMIPVPAAGRLEGIAGLAAARAVPNIEEITVSVSIGDELVPLPEDGACVGFIFASAETPGDVERALRAAHGVLKIGVQETAAVPAASPRRVSDTAPAGPPVDRFSPPSVDIGDR